MRMASLTLAVVCLGCVGLVGADLEADERSPAPSASESAQGRSLFDGKTLAGWRSDRGPWMPTKWEVVDGAIHCRSGRYGRGQLISVEQFANFDLRFEWKIAPGGNSGVKYRYAPFESVYNYSRWLGHEYQLLDDDNHPNGDFRLTSLGAIYGLYAPLADKPSRPPGRWNVSRIVADGPRVDHWLNGQLICGCEVGSPDWTARVAGSKFHDAIGFGKNPSGHLLLQDHGDEVWFRKIEIIELP